MNMKKFKTIQEEVDYIKKQMKILTEAKKYEYGCVMLHFTFPEMKEIHELIDPDDLYEEEGQEYGLETEPHCTLLFGLHEGVPTKDIDKVLGEFTFYTCKAHNVSLFKKDNYEVLKFDIVGDNLEEANKKLKKFPYTSEDSEYKPHMTIAYLKPGTGEKYVKKLKSEKYWLAPQYAIYSKPDRSTDKINIRID
jgi:2'-5' RNA ligase